MSDNPGTEGSGRDDSVDPVPPQAPAPGAATPNGGQVGNISHTGEAQNAGGSTWGQQALRSAAGGPVPDGESGYGIGQGADPASVDGDGPIYGTAAGGGASMSRSSASSRSRPSGPRPIRGPRFSGGPILAGLGLLSMLIVIAIMALLAVKVLDGTNNAGVTGVPGVAGIDELDPGATTDSAESDADDTGGAQTGPSAMDAAKASACRLNKQTIETAVSVYEAMNGQPPATIEQLVTESLLREDPGGFELQPGPEGAVVVGVGDCEGAG